MSRPHWTEEAGLRARLPAFRRKLDKARSLIDRQLTKGHGGYVSWSGGKDSTVCALIAHDVHPGVPLVWVDGGHDYPGHPQWMRDLATVRGWDLDIIPTDPPILDLLAQSGVWDHNAPDRRELAAQFHETLNLAPARIARARHGNVQIIGLRAQESQRRRESLRTWGIVRPWAGGTGVAPIGWWSDDDVWAAHAHYDCPRSPIYDQLEALGCEPWRQRVGGMIDGDALASGRLMWLRRGWPEAWAELEARFPRIKEFA